MPDTFDVVILSPGMHHHGGTLKERSLGGSEASAIHIARALARRHHTVTVLSPGHQGGSWDGVTYVPIEQAPAFFAATPHDVTIVSRQFDAFGMTMQTRLSVLWCHDLAMKRSRAMLGGVAWSIDRIYVLSEFQHRQYREVHGPLLGDDIYHVTHNGIDLEAFAGLSRVPKHRDKLVYGSRPERGLENALNIMDRLAQLGSDLVLHFCCYDNVVPEMRPLYEHLWQRAAGMRNVKNLGFLKQADWHREIASSLACIYPGAAGDFREISCLVSLEAQTCGVPVVAINQGALPESIGDAGILLGDEATNPSTEDYQEQFARTLMELQANVSESVRLSKRGVQRARDMDWSDVARDWELDWERQFSAQRNSDVRLLTHCRRTGDFELATWLEGQSPLPFP